jgi:hypothetical protein
MMKTMKEAVHLVFRETKRLSPQPERLELHMQGVVVELPQVLCRMGRRQVLILTRDGVFHDTREGAPLDEEGEAKVVQYQGTKLVDLDSRFGAPRLATEAANEWFAEGEAFMRALAAKEPES